LRAFDHVQPGAQVESEPGLPAVFSDHVGLVEVVQNLVDNAVKFMGNQARRAD
jgi:light-regulated signal transduction histidine kinase (bacteriophytochrome)